MWSHGLAAEVVEYVAKPMAANTNRNYAISKTKVQVIAVSSPVVVLHEFVLRAGLRET